LEVGIFLRYLWVKRLAKSCVDNVLFEAGVKVTYWKKIELGSNVPIFEICYLDGKGGIKIGNNVSITHQTSLICFEFVFDNFE
jgi:acetyltransferase-like isoleucine patch superfamily enzyme